MLQDIGRPPATQEAFKQQEPKASEASSPLTFRPQLANKRISNHFSRARQRAALWRRSTL
ncbi:hypothetical protein EYF80_057177 [Liparis tanakae]|uniref:Uncharacterized protein n=1 Tax=Liparis tanakae TaxID=230148 RepID=A0A4Z2EVI3_9TELE|nr:hypothetical protein EYF80_057177 [Liparis tanakae]